MPGAGYRFGRFRLDLPGRRLLRDDAPVAIRSRHFDVLAALVAQAGSPVPKHVLVDAGWPDVAVTDNSVEHAIAALRAIVGVAPDGEPGIRTLPRRGYLFSLPVEPLAAADAALDAALGPHRAWLEGRAALETLRRDDAQVARQVFAHALESAPHDPTLHAGLANACAWLFEATRADDRPAVEFLADAIRHAREACRLDVAYAEAWATLGLALHRDGRAADAAAAVRRAIAIEGQSWRHHVRLAFVSWGEERLRAAVRAQALLPQLALARWLAATVHVARQAFDLAEAALDEGIDVQNAAHGDGRFDAVGLHLLRGLLYLRRDDVHGAMTCFERELAAEPAGHLYSRECCANTWYAIGAVRRRNDDDAGAVEAFDQALARVARHAPAAVARAALDPSNAAWTADARAAVESRVATGARTDAAVAVAVGASLRGDAVAAAGAIHAAIAAAPPGNDAWIVPVEPSLRVAAADEAWSGVLALLRARAA